MTTEITRKPGIVYSFATPENKCGRTLFVNVIPQYDCVNNCVFCGRHLAIEGKPNIYEQKAGTRLYLQKPPGVEEVMDELRAGIKKPRFGLFGGTREIAIVGLGEPLTQLDLVLRVIHAIRQEGRVNRAFSGLKIRLDTNGLVKAMYPPFVFGCGELITGDPAMELRDAGLDEIRISVNATSNEEYDALCRPEPDLGKVTLEGGLMVPKQFVRHPFEHLCDFVKDCLDTGMKVIASFVVRYKGDPNPGEVTTKSEGDYRAFAEDRFGYFEKGPVRERPNFEVMTRKFIPPLVKPSNELND